MSSCRLYNVFCSVVLFEYVLSVDVLLKGLAFHAELCAIQYCGYVRCIIADYAKQVSNWIVYNTSFKNAFSNECLYCGYMATYTLADNITMYYNFDVTTKSPSCLIFYVIYLSMYVISIAYRKII